MKNETISTATFGGGCFWCTEAIFNRVEGVKEVLPGFSGGTIKNPGYKEVCTGRTGHAEVIQLTFDSAMITYNELLEIFFETHDPTTLNRQGNDVGTQYRSAIFYHDDIQKQIAEALITSIDEKGTYTDSVKTEVVPFEVFYPAEEEHRNYFNLNKEQSYCKFVIHPKVKKFQEKFNAKLQGEA